MNAIERTARVITEELKDGKPHAQSDLMNRAGLPSTWSGEVCFHQAVGWARMNLCRTQYRREIVTDRTTNEAERYLMPKPGDWEPLAYTWLSIVAQDRKTRDKTILEMVEVWLLNHAGHIPIRIVKKFSRLVNDQKYLARKSDEFFQDVSDFLEAEAS